MSFYAAGSFLFTNMTFLHRPPGVSVFFRACMRSVLLTFTQRITLTTYPLTNHTLVKIIFVKCFALDLFLCCHETFGATACLCLYLNYGGMLRCWWTCIYFHWLNEGWTHLCIIQEWLDGLVCPFAFSCNNDIPNRLVLVHLLLMEGVTEN